MPALQRAHRLGEKASRRGFDWMKDNQGLKLIRNKVTEELGELDTALNESKERMQEELGDLLFVLVQYGRHLDIDTEGALRGACRKFEKRFRSMETNAEAELAQNKEIPSERWDTLWRKAKAEVG